MRKLGYSLALTTYQAGKLAIIYAPGDEHLTVLPRTFDKPMGVDIKGDKMAVATRNELIILENNPLLAKSYPNKPDFYDALFVPRSTNYTGYVDIHDIAFGNDREIWAINTSFSCLCRINGHHNFEPVWKPPFITDLQSEDRCHLNGLTLADGKPRYITALSTSDTPQGWRDTIMEGGILMDVTTNEIILEGLAMPHSPRMYNDELYMVLSASGQLIKVNPETGKSEVIKELDGFCRGLDIAGDYAFVGLSKLRKNSSTFAKLPFAEKAEKAGIQVIHLPSGAAVGEFTFQMSVDEIYEVKVMKGMIRPNVLNTQNEVHKLALSFPGQAFWADPENLKKIM